MNMTAAFAGSVLALAGSMLAGCAQVYRIDVDAVRNERVTGGSSFVVVAQDSSPAMVDADRARTVQLVTAGLQGRGMVVAPDAASADVLVQVACGIGAERVRTDLFACRVPVRESYPEQGGEFGGPESHARALGATGSGGMISGPAPEYTEVRRVPVFAKFLTLTATENAVRSPAARAPAQLWQVTAQFEDENASLQASLPLLVAAAVEHVGTTTTERETLRISEHSPLLAGLE